MNQNRREIQVLASLKSLPDLNERGKKGGRTLIGTPGLGVFKLGISGLILSGSGNSFFSDLGISGLTLFKFGTSGFRVFKPGISGSGPLLSPSLIEVQPGLNLGHKLLKLYYYQDQFKDLHC